MVFIASVMGCEVVVVGHPEWLGWEYVDNFSGARGRHSDRRFSGVLVE
jgi:hypothetical protein